MNFPSIWDWEKRFFSFLFSSFTPLFSSVSSLSYQIIILLLSPNQKKKKKKKVAELTKQAMGGRMTFQEALSARLALMHPTQNQLNDFIANHPLPLTPLVEELVKELVKKGKGVFFVSGGFEEMIIPLAKGMGVGGENVYANQLLFEENGDFKGHNEECFTSRTGGKKEAVKEIKRKYGYKKLVMIGDGVTDGEARSDDGEGADLFIGFGGNVVREPVKEKADYFVYSFKEIMEMM